MSVYSLLILQLKVVSEPPFQTFGFFSDTRAFSFMVSKTSFLVSRLLSTHKSFLFSGSLVLSFSGLQASFYTHELSFFLISFLVSRFFTGHQGFLFF